ncbi:MAG: dTDP-glucose 4,6-dehydratase [Gammaproteobacteria bacterium]
MILVTGGAGFIGTHFVLDWLAREQEPLLVVDKLTYAGNIHNLSTCAQDPRFYFIKGDIADPVLIKSLLQQHKPRALLNFAAESHVDRSILDPQGFITTNVQGTFNLLEITRDYLAGLSSHERENFRFIQISTDEVYGSLTPTAPAFTESTPYAPNSPYSASKAAADHFARAYYHTYDVPVIITNCSNNYGPFQFPEKLIPLMCLNALEGKPLPIYGNGQNIRDWLHVSDHCAAVRLILAKGRLGESYNIGGQAEWTNLAVVQSICDLLQSRRPQTNPHYYHNLIQYVTDRPGHDQRYAMDITKISQELGWQPRWNFSEGLSATIDWYLNHGDWVNQIRTGHYTQWLEENYTHRSVLA